MSRARELWTQEAEAHEGRKCLKGLAKEPLEATQQLWFDAQRFARVQ